MDTVESEYVYLLTYQIDSTDAKNKQEEFFVLQKGKIKSLFMSVNSFKRDSVASEMAANAGAGIINLDFTRIPKTKFSYRIVKDLVRTQVSFYDNIITDYFVYKEDPNFNWKIIEEKKNIGNLKCQAALVSYAGREYKAWFSNDIPISDGPYKFYGLPGMIIEIEDSKKQYKFELLSYKNLEKNNPIWISEKRANGKVVDKSQFYKALKNSNENIIQGISKTGFTIDSSSEAQVRERYKKRNNPLELQP